MKIENSDELKAIRDLGGSRWIEEDTSQDMSFFFGMSCSRVVTSTIDVHDKPGTEPVSFYRNLARWDRTSRKYFNDRVCVGKSTCLSNKQKGRDNFSAFAVMWEFSDGVSTREWSADASSTHELFHGLLQLNLPTVTANGLTNCAAIEKLIHKHAILQYSR